MGKNNSTGWQRYCERVLVCEGLGITLDMSRMGIDPGVDRRMAQPIARAFDEMDALERGAIANPDEQRMVGHYWLRNPVLAPDPAIRKSIEDAIARVKSFAADVLTGRATGPHGDRFENVLWIGIGGSALGPQLLADLFGRTGTDETRFFFLDNTDPDGMDRTFDALSEQWNRTLTIVVSKSGGTVEPRNAMTEVAHAYEASGLSFAAQAVAVTCADSALDRLAEHDRWLNRIPLWDWVGGRTQLTSPVGLLVAALLGADVDALLAGAARMDQLTRQHDVSGNPAAQVALAWHQACRGHGERATVVLPYKDRLALLGRYLQQLVMESLGKEQDRQGKTVHQGLTVYGNKGTTDQHAFVQQLREGPDDFFVLFVEILRDRRDRSIEVEDAVTAGDYLSGFLAGTRQALGEAGRQSMTVTLDDLSPLRVGALVGLFERAVGFYASLIDVNAYHQPGVEAGKKAAADVIHLQRAVLAELHRQRDLVRSADQIAAAVNEPDAAATVYHILRHLAANPGRGVKQTGGPHPSQTRFESDPEI